MLREAMEYLVTPVAPAFRGTRYLAEAVATRSRARRCRVDWAPHLANCRRVVSAAAGGCARQRTALVLGAGLAHDLPLSELSAAFDRVMLVDVVHLWPVRRAARRLGNVDLVAHDVTESALGLIAGRRDVRAPERFLDDGTIDLVVSLNVASQLPVIPLAVLERQGMPEGEADAIGRRLVEAHLDWLDRFDARTCLLMDAEKRVHRRDGTLVDTISAVRGAAVPEPDESWDWLVAPLDEEIRGYSIVNRVIARTR
jgi:hypothetical protein